MGDDVRPVIYPRFPARRTPTGGTWWSKAWARAVEEAAYSVDDLRAGRTLARRGSVGAISIAAGQCVAAVLPEQDAVTVTVTVPRLAADDVATLVELVAAESGRVAALLAGDLPHPLVEAVEEAGVELLPYGGELGAECTCDAWLDPCVHALAVLTQVGWLVQRDPFVLMHLRGVPRERLLGDLHALDVSASGAPSRAAHADDVDADLQVALDAAVRAQRLLGSG